MPVVDYTVVAYGCMDTDGNGLAELERMVKEHIEKGWTPQGGVHVAVAKFQGGNEFSYYQALVRLA